MVALSAFFDHVAPEVLGCPDVVVENAILQSAIEFCQRTGAWRYEHDAIALFEGVADYELEPPSGSKVRRIVTMYHNGEPVEERDTAWLDRNRVMWRTQRGTKVDFFTFKDALTILVVPVPEESDYTGLTDVLVSLVPERDATTVGDVLFDDYLEAIAAGAKWRLMRMPGQEWSNPDLAVYYSGIFRNEISRAKVDMVGATTGLSVHLSRFG